MCPWCDYRVCVFKDFGSFERSNACVCGSSCLGVLQKISPRTPSTHLLRSMEFSCQDQAASHGLQIAYTCLGSNMGSKFSRSQHSKDGN